MFTFLAMAAPPEGGAGGQGGIAAMLPTILMFAAIFAIFYFMIIRPQKKRASEHQNLLSSIQRGDKVVMTGGIHGTVFQVEDKTVLVEVSKNAVIKFEKSSVQGITKAETEA